MTIRKVLVCGSRDWTDEGSIREALEPIIDACPPWADEPTVIHGAARGADSIVHRVAIDLGFWVGEYPPDYKRFGKRAPLIRNVQMLDQNPDLVLAFQRNGSRGTQHTIDEARKRGIEVRVFTEEESP